MTFLDLLSPHRVSYKCWRSLTIADYWWQYDRVINIICSLWSREGTEGWGREGSGPSTRQEAECQLQHGGGPRPPGVLRRAGGFGGRHDGGGGQDGRLRPHVPPPHRLPLLQVTLISYKWKLSLYIADRASTKTGEEAVSYLSCLSTCGSVQDHASL